MLLHLALTAILAQSRPWRLSLNKLCTIALLPFEAVPGIDAKRVNLTVREEDSASDKTPKTHADETCSESRLAID
jgi:hypothetical protein